MKKSICTLKYVQKSFFVYSDNTTSQKKQKYDVTVRMHLPWEQTLIFKTMMKYEILKNLVFVLFNSNLNFYLFCVLHVDVALFSRWYK